MPLSPCRPLLAFVLSLVTAAAAAAEGPAVDVPALIDKLTDVADSDIGYSPSAWGNPFLPLDREGAWGGGLLFQKPEVPSDTLRAIVKHGAAAVPFLIAHLDDKRATKLTITNNFVGVFERIDYCDFNARTAKEDPNPKPPTDKDGFFGSPVPGGRHVVTVGDLCFVALGQIVNRGFVASFYFPSGNVFITSPTDSPALREALKKEWAGLTPERHKASLIDDFLRPDSDERRIGACKRLAYYYPDALEPLAVKFLAQPTYNPQDVNRFVHDTLYAADGAKERQALFDAYIAKHGAASRDGILLQLFDDLDLLEANEQHRLSSPLKDFSDQPRQCLIELYGKGKDVKSADRPLVDRPSASETARLIEEGLIYDRSPKIDAAVRDLLASIDDDDYLAAACMKRLVGRGFDEDVARCCRRRIPLLKDSKDKQYLQKYLDRAGWTRLHVAVDRHDGDEVQRLLAEKAEVNAAAKDGRTPLHLAAEAGDREIVQALLDGKADLNPKDAAGWTPVQLAARQDHEDVVLLLAKCGCELPDILSAASCGGTEVVEALLKKDPKQLEATNVHGGTPLHLAARRGHVRTAQALLAAGATVGAKDEDGWTPLHLAADGGHEEVVRLLLDKKADPNAVNNQADKLSPLHAAVLSGKRQIVELLMEHGADPNLGHDGEHGSPLHLVVGRGLPDIVVLLLEKGAKVDLKNKDGWTPLHLAAQAGHEDMARILLDHKAEVDAQGKDGRRPLHEAAGAGHRKVVELLLDCKADVGARDATGRTPLHSAVAGNQLEIVALLLDMGADVNARAKDGETPLYDALEDGAGADMVRALLEREAKSRGVGKTLPSGPLHLAAASGDRTAVKLLLDQGAEADARDNDGTTALHWAASGGNVDVVQELVDHGAAVNAQTKDGSTPLHFAVENGNAGAVVRLLDYEADPTVKNAKGETPLDCLPAKGEPAKHAAQIKGLLQPFMKK